MTGPQSSDAEMARERLRGVTGSGAAQAYATLALANALERSALAIAEAMIEVARIRTEREQGEWL